MTGKGMTHFRARFRDLLRNHIPQNDAVRYHVTSLMLETQVRGHNHAERQKRFDGYRRLRCRQQVAKHFTGQRL